jgi:hypothetical protein
MDYEIWGYELTVAVMHIYVKGWTDATTSNFSICFMVYVPIHFEFLYLCAYPLRISLFVSWL